MNCYELALYTVYTVHYIVYNIVHYIFSSHENHFCILFTCFHSRVNSTLASTLAGGQDNLTSIVVDTMIPRDVIYRTELHYT